MMDNELLDERARDLLRWRNPWLPFILGMGVLLVMRKGLGW